MNTWLTALSWKVDDPLWRWALPDDFGHGEGRGGLGGLTAQTTSFPLSASLLWIQLGGYKPSASATDTSCDSVAMLSLAVFWIIIS